MAIRITGLTADETQVGDLSLNPFDKVTVTDTNPKELLQVWIFPGSFFVLGYGTPFPNTLPTLSGAGLNGTGTPHALEYFTTPATAAGLTQILRGITFEPIPVGTTISEEYGGGAITFGVDVPPVVGYGIALPNGATAGLSITEAPAATFIVQDFSVGNHAPNEVIGTPYTGSRVGPTSEYAPITSDNLYVYSNSPNVFVYPGSGSSSIINLLGDGGTNVLSAGHGNDTLIGGVDQNTFVIEGNTATRAVSDLVQQFHAGDAIDVWGIVQGGRNKLTWTNDPSGAGVTVTATGPGHPAVSVDIGGYHVADVGTHLAVSYATAQGAELIITGR